MLHVRMCLYLHAGKGPPLYDKQQEPVRSLIAAFAPLAHAPALVVWGCRQQDQLCVHLLTEMVRAFVEAGGIEQGTNRGWQH